MPLRPSPPGSPPNDAQPTRVQASEAGNVQQSRETDALPRDHEIEDTNAPYPNQASGTGDFQFREFMDDFKAEAENEVLRLCDYVRHTVTEGVNERYKMKAQRSKRQFQELIVQKRALEQDYKELANRNERLERRLQKLNESQDKTRQERDAQKRIAETGGLANSEKISDDVIRGKWMQLEYNVRSLAHFLSQQIPKEPTSTVAQDRFDSVTKDWTYILPDEDLRQLLLQAYIWHCIIENVFSLGCGMWHGYVFEAFKVLRHRLITKWIDSQEHGTRASALRQITQWCGQGSRLVQETVDFQSQQTVCIIQSEIEILHTFLSIDQASLGEFEGRTRNELKDIFERAMEVDRMITTSRALFFIEWSLCPEAEGSETQYQESNMVAEAWARALSAESVVKFFVTPFLTKKGNADGNNHEKNSVLIKAHVVCN